MQLVPAIDLRGGQCVRLLQGRFDAETVYGNDPVAILGRYRDLGARYVHVVDLDGALCSDGYPETLHGVQVYNDFLHFSPEVTPMLWKWLLGQVSTNYATS